MKIALIAHISALSLLCIQTSYSQTCTSNPTPISSDTNLSSLSWTGAGGVSNATCAAIAAGTNTTTTANFVVDLSNNTILTVNTSVKINGNFDIKGGNGSELSINGGGTATTFNVTGDLGDATNNGVIYNVQASSDHITVGGTLYGKNNDALIGNGTISGTAIDVKNGTTCGTPCPATGGFSSCTAGDSFCSTYTVLPVTLVFFEASLAKESVQLNWATSTELNFDYFSVEKSLDGRQFFNMDKVQGHGTTNIRQEYQTLDENPAIGFNYYRLTSVDFDNYRETFKVVAIKFEGDKKIALSPNPFTGSDLNFSANFDLSGTGTLTIYDGMGFLVTSLSIADPNSAIHFSTPLKAGVYIAKFNSTSCSNVIRLVVQ